MPPARKWGGVARRGADNVAPAKRQGRQRGQGGRGRDGRGQGGRSGGQQRSPERKGAPELGPPPAWEPEEWIQEPDTPVRTEAGRAVARGAKGAKKPAEAPRDRPRRKAPAQVAQEITSTVGSGKAGRVEQRLMEAARTFERERYKDADRMLRTLLDRAPDVPA